MEIVGSREARERLRMGYERGLLIPNARDMLALGQLEQVFVQEYGPEIGRRAFLDWVTSVAATTAGANPSSNLMMAGYANFARVRGLPYTEGAHKLPFPVGGRFATPNMKIHDEFFDRGGWSAVGAQNPKRHDFAQGMLGNPRVGVIDEQMTRGMVPGRTVPPQGTYGIFQRVVQEEADRAGVLPRQFSDLARAGFIASKHPGHRIQPMISDVNDTIERIHRLVGTSHDDVVRGLVRSKIPYFGLGGLGILPSFGERSEPSIGRDYGAL